MILFVACLSVFFETIDVSAVNLAIPSLQKEWNAGAGYFEWVQTIYVLFYGGFLLLGGRLADRIGRKRIYLFGSAVFLCASFGAFFAASLPFLLCCRAMQGLGAAFAIPAAISIITNLYTDVNEVNRGLGIFGAFAAIGFASGLMFGAITVSSLGWKWIFGVNVVVILPVLVMAMIMIPADEKREQQLHHDVRGGTLLTLFLLLFTFTIHASGSQEQKKWVITAALLTVMFGCLFYYFEKKNTTPLLNYNLFKEWNIVSSNLAGILLGASFMSYISILSVYVQEVVHLSLVQAGLFLFPFSIISAGISKWWLPFLQKKYPLKPVANIGLFCMFLGNLFLVACCRQYHWGLLLLSAFFINGVSMAIAYPSLTALAIQDAEPQDHGMAAGLQSTSYSAGCGIGIALVWTIIRIWFPGTDTFSSSAIGLGAALCGTLCLAAMIINSVNQKP